MKVTKKLIMEMIEEEIEESRKAIVKGRGIPSGWSTIKPWESALVFFDKGAGAPPIPKGMVRVKAQVDGTGTFKLKKNYQQNWVQLLVYKDTIANDGSYSAQPIYIKVPGDKMEPDPEGRFFDIDGWYLKKVGLASKYLELLDSRGKILATKKQQNKWS